MDSVGRTNVANGNTPRSSGAGASGKRFRNSFGSAASSTQSPSGSSRGASSHRHASSHKAAPGYRPSSYGSTGRAHSGRRAPAPRSGRLAPAYERSSRRKGSKLPVIIGILLALAVIALSAFVLIPRAAEIFAGDDSTASSVPAGQEVSLTIPEGASGDVIAKTLSENHVIEDPKNYYAAVKKLSADTKLKPGNYLFTTGQDPIEVVKQLMAGPNADSAKLTVAEGLTVSQTAAKVQDALGISSDDFIAQAKASNYVADFPFLQGAADDSLEGFLFPKTYTFTDAPTADEVIRAMLKQYQSEVSALDFDAARNSLNTRYGVDLSDYQILVLASVIEREARNEDQRYNVSSTFYNRMKAGMPLQSDATMMYVTGGAVTADDLKKESPYNTYLNKGLPPTPICSPSLSSIKASIEPLDTTYLYFYLSQNDEYFSETYDEHLAAIAKVK